MSRIDSPTNGWDSVERVHGRLRWADDDKTPARKLTPVTALDLDPLLAAWRAVEREKTAIAEGMRARARRTKLVLLGLALAAFAALALGCAHQEAGPGVVVLPEKAGSIAAKAIRAAVGQEPKAATIPGGPTVVFQPDDADDVCLVEAHEGQHRMDQAEMGTVAWTLTYVDQYLECVGAGRERAWCLRSMPLEVVAYRQQHACQAARAAGRPWPPVSVGPRWRAGWGECMAKGGGR